MNTTNIFTREIPGIISRIRKSFYLQFNKKIFNANNIKYGKNLRVYNKIFLTINSNASVIIGDNFKFTSGEAYNPLCRNIQGCIYAEPNAKILIGDNVGISSACLWAKTGITIGNNVKIGGDCILMDTDAHNLDYRIRNSFKKNEHGVGLDISTAKSLPIVIENDVLIGTRCVILKGVTIGARSIIGSGSIVTKSIPSDCIAAGNPCKIIKYI